RADVERFLEIGHELREHGEQAGNMEPADDHLDAGRTQRARQIEGAWILVRLDPDEPDEPEIAVAAEVGNDLVDADPSVRLVDRGDLHGALLAEHLALDRS